MNAFSACVLLRDTKYAYWYCKQLESPELKFSGPDKLGRIEYFEHLRNAKFCLAPRGESSWSLRYYESYFVVSLSLSLSDCTYAHPRTHTHTGWAVDTWSNVVVSAKQECVPVLISDQVELPFQNVIDYTQISIKWPSTQIGPQMLEYLESIPGQIQTPLYIIAWLTISFNMQ